MSHSIRRPLLVRHARHRWDAVRGQHQLVYPEGLLVLNDTAAAIVQLCDGRPVGELLDGLKMQFPDSDPAADVEAFLDQLARKGLLRDAANA